MHVLPERVAGQKQSRVAQRILRLSQRLVGRHQSLQRLQIEPLQAIPLLQAPVVVEALQEVAFVQNHRLAQGR